MTKLSVANLFDAVRTLQSVARFDVQPVSPPVEHSEAAERRTSADERPAGLDGPEVALAIQRAFDTKHDRLLGAHARVRLEATTGERLTRIDHDYGTQTAGGSVPHFTEADPSADRPLSKALGLVEARDLSAQQHWIVVVLDSAAVSTALDQGDFESLLGARQLLVIWADDDPGQRARVSFLSERVESLTGLTQIGPVDGLDEDGLVLVLQALKTFEQPALLYVRLRPATADRRLAGGKAPRVFGPAKRGDRNGLTGARHAGADGAHRIDPAHGPAPAMRELLRAVAEHADAHSHVVAVNLLGDDIFQANGRPLPKWLLRPPPTANIAWYEGLVAGGYHPVLLLEQGERSRSDRLLLHDAWRRRLPLTVVSCPGPGATAQSPNASVRRTLSGDGSHLLPVELPVIAPATTSDLGWMLDLAAKQTMPVMMIVPAGLAPIVPSVFALPPPPEFGRGRLICEGSDVALISWGATIEIARRAAFELARAGIEASVINPVFLRPLDDGLIASVARRVQRTVIIEDPALPRDLMLELLRVLSEGGETAPFVRVVLDAAALAEDEDGLVSQVVRRCRENLRPSESRAELPAQRAPSTGSISSLPSARSERAAVSASPLSADVSRWIEAYAAVGKRNLYLWRWARLGAELTTLPCVAPEMVAPVCDTKVLSIMLCVLLDDVADMHGRGEFLEVLVRLVCDLKAEDFSQLAEGERHCAEVVYELSQQYDQRVRSYPRFGEFQEMLRYDASQFANTLRYSHLLNRHTSYLNLAEHDLYLPHNMHMMSFATLDLMCTDDFPREHLGDLREAAWHGQCMGRIGNLLSTWRRGLRQKDFTSGIFARALASGDLSTEQIANEDVDQIERVLRGGKHQFHFIRRWQHHRDCLEAAIARVRGVNLRALLDGHDRFFQMHVASQGII